MKSQPLVSILIPFYNEERFLKEAVDSVLDQTYPDWEILLINDGSDDGSLGIAKELIAKHPQKIRLLSHQNNKNKGLSASRNLGLKFATGEYIALLDADDVWLPSKLENQISMMSANPEADMLLEASVVWYSWQKDVRSDQQISIGAKADTFYAPGELIHHLYPLSQGAAPVPSAILIRKSALLELGGFEEHFNGHLQLYEDQAFLHKFYLNKGTWVSSACHTKYRQRQGSLMATFNTSQHYHIVRRYFLEWLEEYSLKTKHYQSLAGILTKALRPYRSPMTSQLISFAYKVPGVRFLKQKMKWNIQN